MIFRAFGLKPYFHLKGRGGGSVITKKDQLLNQRFWFLGFIKDVKKYDFPTVSRPTFNVQSKTLISTNKAFSMMKYLDVEHYIWI